MARIVLQNVGLTFRVRPQGRILLKDVVVSHIWNKSLRTTIQVDALQDISLQLAEGDRLGIIGHNGAGKTTLLRVLAGVYHPTTGQRIVEGKIGSLFEIALGFEGEATGWENIAYRGYLQGETPGTIHAKRQAIAEFSELGKFLAMPVRYYSAGMMIRLAFAIATAMEPEVLLIDEVLSAGDLSFQHKARQRIHAMMGKARIIVVASHDLHALAELCEQAIWLDHGKIRMSGATATVVPQYIADVHRTLPSPADGGPQPLAPTA